MRLPGRRRSERPALGRRLDAAVELVELDVGRKARRALGGALDLGDAGQEGEQRSFMLAKRARIAEAICGSIRAAASRPTYRTSSGKLLPSLTIVGGLPSKPLEALDVERRRHGDQPQIVAQRAGRVERQRQREIVVEAALVHLVEQHGGDAGKLRIGLDARQEHAVGHGDDARALADLAVEPRRVADRLARLLARAARP